MIDLRMEDCIQGMQAIPPSSVSLIFADPPYNLSGESYLTVHAGRPVVCDKGEWDSIDNVYEFNRTWLSECVRVLADDGTLWVSGTLHNHPSVGMAMKDLGMWIINDVIWYKRNASPLMARNRFAPSTELIWVAAKSKRYFFNYEAAKTMNEGKQMRNLWEIKAEKHKTKHPTEKPETLLTRIIKIGSQEGGLVLDPFMGSGTTGVVANRLGRKFIGFETNPEYFEIAAQRINTPPVDETERRKTR